MGEIITALGKKITVSIFLRYDYACKMMDFN
jgi:hypothetical protein